MSRISDRISALVSQQLPEFVRSDYTTFVSFLEAYYRFIEQDQNAQELIQNARQYSDIDKTAASFIQYFLKNYGSTIPTSVLSNKPLLIKRLNDLYAAKGSELSFKLLFRILFDTSVTLKQPYEFVLKPSEGIWEQQISLRVRRTSGSISDVLNRNLVLVKSGITYNASIYRIKNLDTDLYEFFIKTRAVAPYEIEDEVTVSSTSGVIFTGTVDPTPTGYSILSGGSGFKTGQIFTVNIAGAVNTVVQISKVTGTGAISALKFISYGYNFPNGPVTIDLYNDLTIASRSYTARTKTNSISEFFDATLIHTVADPNRYFLTDYVAEGYTGALLLQQTTNPGITGGTTFTSIATDPSVATIEFSMGAVGRYPGQFISNKGFLSEPDVRLQDDKLYQPFAYQLETDIDISKFYDIVKLLIHPAGTNLFNNRTITTEANIKANVSVIASSNIFNEIYSVFEVLDSKTYNLNKVLTDNTLSSSNTVFTLNKPVFDTLSELDDVTLQVNSELISSTSGSEESIFFSINPLLQDVSDAVDALVKDVSLSINNNDSTVSFTESVYYVGNNYAEPGYFAELYAGSPIQLL